MSIAQREHPRRLVDRRRRGRVERPARSASRPRRNRRASEAVVAGYIRDLAAHDRRAHGAIGARGGDEVSGPFGPVRSGARWQT
jgi:hypothetical protein